MNQRLEEGGDAEAHVNKTNELFQKMLALGDNIRQDLIFSAVLLGSLPESYDNLITALEARDEELTLNLVCSKVISEYKRRLERKTDNSGESIMRISSSFNRDSFSCHFCKGQGHIRSTKNTEWLNKNKVAKNKPDDEAKKPGVQGTNMIRAESDREESREEFIFVIAAAIRGWLLDSGANSHSVSERKLFVEIDSNYRERVKVANGQLVDAVGICTIQVEMINKSGVVTKVKMENV